MKRPACCGARKSCRRCGPTADRSCRSSGQRDAVMGYIAKRLALALAVVLVVMALLFVMIYLIPGDPARVALGPRATQALIDELHARMGLDKPIWVQIVNFYRSALTGDLGNDVLSGESVLRIIAGQMPYTLSLIFGSMLWSVLLGIPLGCLAAMRRGSIIDQVTALLSVS